MNKAIVLTISIWITGVATSYFVLLNESTLPASLGQRVPDFGNTSTESALVLLPHRKLVMFAHPMCPCTRASLRELERLLTKTDRSFETIVSFSMPTDATSDWTDSDLVRVAKSIPGIQIQFDSEGAEAARYAIQASGHVLLMEPDGTIAFSGGITPERGHEGMCLGAERLLKQLSSLRGSTETSAVFGCSLRPKD